jgi:hypothetical protein
MGALIKEVCATAGEVYKIILKNESSSISRGDLKTNGKTVKRINVLKDKLYDLSFIHPHIKTVHDAMESSLQQLSSRDTGLRGREHFNFRLLIESLIDQHEVVARLESNLALISVCENETPPLENVSLFEDADTCDDKQGEHDQSNINNLDECTPSDKTSVSDSGQISIFL